MNTHKARLQALLELEDTEEVSSSMYNLVNRKGASKAFSSNLICGTLPPCLGCSNQSGYNCAGTEIFLKLAPSEWKSSILEAPNQLTLTNNMSEIIPGIRRMTKIKQNTRTRRRNYTTVMGWMKSWKSFLPTKSISKLSEAIWRSPGIHGSTTSIKYWKLELMFLNIYFQMQE